MASRAWHSVSREVAYKDPRLTVFNDTIINEAGDTSGYTLVDFSDAVFIVAETKDAKIALVQQHRYPLGRVQTELIAGGLPSGVDPVEQAINELHEEAQLSAIHIELLGSFAMQPNRAINTGYVLHALVEGDDASTAANQEVDESIEGIVFADKLSLPGMVTSGEISGAYCLASLALYWQSQAGGQRQLGQ